MRKITIAALLFLVYAASHGQNRKHSSNFSILQQYYNPAFTGFKGSSVKAYYRNQWSGFDGAPKTLFVSGEVNLADYLQNATAGDETESSIIAGIQHSVGGSVLHDTYGPFVENQVFASYRSFVNLTEKIQLQAGAAIGFFGQRIDGSKLTSQEYGDPSLQQYVDRTTRSGRIDFNLGIGVSGQDFYAGYAMQNIKGGIQDSDRDFFRNNSKVHYVVQGGYRRAVSDKVGLVFNGLFRFDGQLKETVEGQIKGVFYNTVWLGLGYRNALAYSLNIGFRVNQFKVGYGYEIPTGDAQMTGSGTSEVLIIYDLQKIIHPKLTRRMSVW